MDFYTIIFYLFAVITLVSGFIVVTSKNIMHAAVSLFVMLFSVAVFYVLLYADFIAITQIMVYIGGILVLLIFGIMLTHKITEADLKTSNLKVIPAMIFTVGITAIIISVVLSTKWNVFSSVRYETTVEKIGVMFLTNYLLPFEVASIVLLVALIGAAMYARKK
ncbi:MAG: NADH-quinone oxidoreductase subunit J family protein [Ignavibacteria bacterium]